MRKHVYEPRVIDTPDAVAGKSAFIASPEFFAWIKEGMVDHCTSEQRDQVGGCQEGSEKYCR